MTLISMLKMCSVFCIIFGLKTLFSVAASNSELESLCSIRSDVTRCEFTVPKAPISNYMMTVYDGVNQEQVKKISEILDLSQFLSKQIGSLPRDYRQSITWAPRLRWQT